jgi:hypothetical protein
MTLARDKLADIATVASSSASIYSNPAGKKSYIRGLVLFNGNTSTETVKLYNVPDNATAVGTAAPTNQWLEYSLAAKETLIVEFPYPLVLTDTNDSLQASTNTASKVTVQLQGDRE